MKLLPHALFDPLTARLQRIARAFDVRPQRERMLIFVAVVAGMVMLADALWLTPAFRSWSAARTQQRQAASALQALLAEIEQTGTAHRAQSQQLRSEIEQMRNRVRDSQSALRQFQGTLVGAREMVPLLEQLLAQHGGLKVRAMQSLPKVELSASVASTLTGAAGADATTANAAPNALSSPTLYRQGVELVVEGSYNDLLAYVGALEALPQRLLWGGMQLSVEQHPKILLTLRVYTLGLDRNWLEI